MQRATVRVGTGAGRGQAMAGEKILVVDDEPLNAKLLAYFLRPRGYEVEVAADAEQALELIPTFQPRLLLLDVQLPGMDGLELTRILKSAPETRHIVVVAVTAFAMKGDEEKTLAAGCDAYVAKPVDRMALLAKIETLLQTKGTSEPAVGR